MIAAAGQAGKALNVQKSLGTARKPFRIFKARPWNAPGGGHAATAQPGASSRPAQPVPTDPPAPQPLEALLPLLTAAPAPLTPLLLASKARAHARPRTPALTPPQVKALALAVFFGGDHLVWADGAGLLGSKEAKELAAAAGRLSLRGWFLASLCQLAADLAELRDLHAARAAGKEGAEGKVPSQEALTLRWASASAAAGQAVVSAGLAGLVPLPPRAIGAVGVATSVVQLYSLLPPLPASKGKGKAA